MKSTVFVGVALGLLMTCISCSNPPSDEATNKRISELEARVATLQTRSDDIALKGRIASGLLFLSPLDRFFASPEFWENTYDSGQADCAKRCATQLQTEYAACANNANPTQCRTDALAKGSMCQTNCSKNFPPPIP
jgi:hypothetical protein